MNPDESIKVVVVFPNGLAVYYGHVDKSGVRPRMFNKQFSTYGLARLTASEYESAQRAERAKRAK